MAHKLSAHDIHGLGFDWPKYALIEQYCVIEDGKVDLTRTMEGMQSSQAYYQKQLRDAFNFKMQSGADYADFTDRFDDYARMDRDLGMAISYLEKIIEAARGLLLDREVLGQLTEDVEAKLARRAITQENASRLRKLMAVSGQVLVEVAPDLIGLFVPGANIVGELGKAVAESWLDGQAGEVRPAAEARRRARQPRP